MFNYRLITEYIWAHDPTLTQWRCSPYDLELAQPVNDWQQHLQETLRSIPHFQEQQKWQSADSRIISGVAHHAFSIDDVRALRADIFLPAILCWCWFANVDSLAEERRTLRTRDQVATKSDSVDSVASKIFVIHPPPPPQPQPTTTTRLPLQSN